MPDVVGFVHNPQVPEAAKLVDLLVESSDLAERHWVASSAALDISAHTLESTSVIVTVGGDGTVLRAVPLAAPKSVPILGINMRRVGFICELTGDEALQKISSYITGNPRVEERMMLQAAVTSPTDTDPRLIAHGLNEVVVGRGALSRVLEIEVAVDGAPLATYRADGVITATATGSTGYAMSAGGVVVYPEARLMLIQPLAPYMTLQTGLIVPEESVVEVGIGGQQLAVVTVDGVADTALSPDDRVVIERSPHVARFLRAGPQATFYSSLTRRLGVQGR